MHQNSNVMGGFTDDFDAQNYGMGTGLKDPRSNKETPNKMVKTKQQQQPAAGTTTTKTPGLQHMK